MPAIEFSGPHKIHHRDVQFNELSIICLGDCLEFVSGEFILFLFIMILKVYFISGNIEPKIVEIEELNAHSILAWTDLS